MKTSFACDSIFTLNLTITKPVIINRDTTVCERLTWRGENYDNAGSYADTVKVINGCDSIYTLNLTIAKPDAIVESATACSKYSWRGKSYETSGTYSDTLKMTNGCDSIYILDLTILEKPQDLVEEATACESFVWRGQTYKASGTYQDTVKNDAACDSIFVLNLIINNNPDSVSIFVQDASCNVSNGSVTIGKVSGGTSPFEFNFNNLGFSDSLYFDSIDEGSYKLIVKDANGCILNAPDVNIKNQGALSLAAKILKASCNNLNTGSALVKVSGGKTPYTYSWSGNVSSDSIANNLAAADYLVLVSDSVGCSDSVKVSIAKASDIVLTSNQNNANCGIANGSATVIASGGKAPYSYLWSNGDSTKTADSLAANTFKVQVSDANNCEATMNVNIGNNNGPVISSTNSVPASCTSTCDGIATIKVVGGKAPYTYKWDNGETQTLKNTKACAGKNQVEVIDANKCVATASIEVSALKTDPVFTGTVSLNQNPMTAGKVQLFKFSTAAGAFEMLAEARIDNDGKYSITGLQAGSYLVAVEPDSLLYPLALKTYYSSKTKWSDADTITAYCDSVKEIDFSISEMAPLNGIGTITGKVLTRINGKRTADPVSGVNLSLQQMPSNKVVAQTYSDAEGNFIFTKVPKGQFKIYVDIPGLGMVNTYTVEITDKDTLADNKVFYVDSTGTIDIVAPSSVAPLMSIATNAKVYPNPYLNNTNIAFDMMQAGNVQIEVINLLGKRVAMLENKTLSAGKHLYPFSAKALGEAAGVYFVKLKVNEQIQVFRIVEME